MFKRTLTTILAFICFLSISFADDKYSSFRELKKIPSGMNIIHNGSSNTAIVAVHGFYPVYWIEIHHEWVQPFNYLVEKDINTFFYKYDWNECPSIASKGLEKELENLIERYPNIDNWQINQPILIREIYTLLDKVEGVQTVENIEIVNKVGGEYSPYAYDIKGATIKQILYPSLDPSIFEVKNPDIDLFGRVVSL